MEVEKRRGYHFQVEGTPLDLSLDESLLQYFPTLARMIEDVSEMPLIPLLSSLQPAILEWAFKAAEIINQEEYVGTLDELYKLRDERYPQIPLLLFGPNEPPTVKDIFLLIEVTTELDWLASKKLLLLVLKKLYELMDTVPTDILKEWPLRKRKFEEEALESSVGLPLTLYYQRETLIQRILGELMVAPLIRARYTVQKQITPICLGAVHQLYLTTDGLYGGGWNHKGQLGFTKVDNLWYEPFKLSVPGKPLLIACAASHSLCWTTGGLYVTGDNSYGQLSLGEKSEVDQWTPVPLEGEVLILETSERHTVILTTLGLYTCGSNESGELALGDFKRRAQLTRVDFPPSSSFPVFRIRCARGVTFIQTKKALYGCGLNRHNLLPRLQPNRSYNRLIYLSNTPGNTVLDMNCSAEHIVLSTTTGLYGCGFNRVGQLGLPRGGVFGFSYSNLTRIESISKPPQQIACGEYFTAIVNEDGLFTTGINEAGQLGLGDRENRYEFTKVSLYEGEVKALVANRNTLVFLTTTGLYATGYIQALTTTQSSNYFDLPLKLPLQMGYRWEAPLIIEEESKKRIKLQCEFCHASALYLKSDSLPLCSKYCLLEVSNKEVNKF